MNNIKLSNLNRPAKIFVGFFTALMVMVCIWAVLIYYVEIGVTDRADLPEYMKTDSAIEDFDNTDKQESPASEDEVEFNENVEIAHTHINGQTLLFFAIGLVFLFSSAPDSLKKKLYIIFGVAVIVHTIGLTGQGYNSIFEDILALSGMGIIISILYMSLYIFIDLSKQSNE